MNTTLQTLLDAMAVAPKPRYPLEEVAYLLDARLQAVKNLIKNGKLKGVKTGPRKWGYVLHSDLEAFVTNLNGGAL
ncbi:hypothetical protein [Geothrix sp. 21YS21S-2]|uniref:hypothetical protein n=1 Tax=Geothrix sp. 21YS21S-2 TaxID=3068893 RepID=UPI0027BAFA0A|nr:hypothetical protein [Geothrix sp. 21YS21S-2]